MEYSCIIKGPIKDGKGRVAINIEVDSDPEGADNATVEMNQTKSSAKYC